MLPLGLDGERSACAIVGIRAATITAGRRNRASISSARRGLELRLASYSAIDTIVSLSSYRDVSAMWLRAGDLFNEQTNEELAKADSGLTTLFSGKDFRRRHSGRVAAGNSDGRGQAAICRRPARARH